MIASLLIVFREMLEMSLLLGLLFAAVRGQASARIWLVLGVLAGVCVAVLLAVFMEQLESSLDGDGEFVFNAAVLFMAALLLAWTVLWMREQGRAVGGRLADRGRAVREGRLPAVALAGVAAAAVMREGSETVFFLFGVARGADPDGWAMLIGGIAGALLALSLGMLLYLGMLRIPLGRLFGMLGLLLAVMAAGMVARGVEQLVTIAWLPPLVDPLWDSSWLIESDSLWGDVLHLLVGYTDRPSGMQVAAFVLSLLLLVALAYGKGRGFGDRQDRALRPVSGRGQGC